MRLVLLGWLACVGRTHAATVTGGALAPVTVSNSFDGTTIKLTISSVLPEGFYIGVGWQLPNALGDIYHGNSDALCLGFVDNVPKLVDGNSPDQFVVPDEDGTDWKLLSGSLVNGVATFEVSRSVVGAKDTKEDITPKDQVLKMYVTLAPFDGGFPGQHDDQIFESLSINFLNPDDNPALLVDVDPGYGVLLSFVVPLSVFALYKLTREYQKSQVRQYEVIERGPRSQLRQTASAFMNRMSNYLGMGGRGQQMGGAVGPSGPMPSKVVVNNYAPKSLNTDGTLNRIRVSLRQRVLNDITLGQALLMLTGVALSVLWVLVLPDTVRFGPEFAWGYACIAAALLTVIPATRNSVLTWLLGMPFERSIMYHRWLGRFVVLAGWVHTILILLRDKAIAESRDPPLEYDIIKDFFFNEDEPKYVNGTYSLIGLTLLWLTSFDIVRRKCYAFFRAMHFTFFVFFIFGCIHTYQFIFYSVVAGVLYGLDLTLRYAIHLWPKQVYTVDVLPGEVVRLRFPKNSFKEYEAGQYVFLLIPAISLTEWHPFTLSNGPYQDYLEVHVKALGDWTGKLLDEGAKVMTGQSRMFPRVCVDGPYGKVSFNYKRYESIFLVGGGVGVTPSMAILRDIFQIEVSEQTKAQHPVSPFLKNVFFMWSVKNSEPWSWFYDGLTQCMLTSVNQAAMGYPKLRVKGYVSKPDPKYPGLLNAVSRIPNYSISEGRPEVDRVVAGMQEAIGQGKKRVAVILCGPSSLVNAVWDSCQKATRNGVQFDLHRETFDF